jgi:hypothetical protein
LGPHRSAAMTLGINPSARTNCTAIGGIVHHRRLSKSSRATDHWPRLRTH